MVDYYQILEVPRTASANEIKASYKRLAMKFHPDHNQNNPFAEDYFKRVTEAYRVLGDMNRKYVYDASLAVPTYVPTPRPANSEPYQASVYDAPYQQYNGYEDERKSAVSPQMRKKIWIGTGIFGILMIVCGLWVYSYLNERSAKIYLDQAKQLYKDNEPRQALVRITNAIGHKINYHEAYMLRAKIRQDALNYYSALEDYELVLQYRPFKEPTEKAEIFFLRGMCYYKSYDFKNALKEFELTLAQVPKNQTYQFFKTACLIKEGNQSPELCADAMRAHHQGIKEAEELVRIYCTR